MGAEGERILLVGAGAVGLVYARHLQRGGAKVALYVRPRYVEALRGGAWMWPLNEGRKAVRFEGYEVLSSPEEVAARTWDQVWLCVSSTALRAGDWVDALAAVTGEAVWVTLQPGLADRDWLLKRIPAARLISGIITFISWAAPLPGETVDPAGIMYWLPPLTPNPFSGPAAPVGRIVALLEAGGCAARAVKDAGGQTAIGSGVLNPIIAALETAGWTFAGFRASRAPELAIAAVREATTISAAYVGAAAPGAIVLLRPWMLRLATRLAPWIMPFDIETYLRVHFTKVGDQTRAGLETWIDEGGRRGLAVAALTRLRAGLPALGG